MTSHNEICMYENRMYNYLLTSSSAMFLSEITISIPTGIFFCHFEKIQYISIISPDDFSKETYLQINFDVTSTRIVNYSIANK